MKKRYIAALVLAFAVLIAVAAYEVVANLEAEQILNTSGKLVMNASVGLTVTPTVITWLTMSVTSTTTLIILDQDLNISNTGNLPLSITAELNPASITPAWLASYLTIILFPSQGFTLAAGNYDSVAYVEMQINGPGVFAYWLQNYAFQGLTWDGAYTFQVSVVGTAPE